MGSLKKCLEKSSFSKEVKAAIQAKYDAAIADGLNDEKAKYEAVNWYGGQITEKLDKFKADVQKQFGKEFDFNQQPEQGPEQPTELRRPAPKPEPSLKEQAGKKYNAFNISKVYDEPSEDFREAVLKFFLNKGRISTADFKRYTGFGDKNERKGKVRGWKEFKNYIWAHKKNATPIDNLVRSIWGEDMNRNTDEIDEQGLINELIDTLREHSGLGSMRNELVNIYNDRYEANNADNMGKSDEEIAMLQAEEDALQKDIEATDIEEGLQAELARSQFEAAYGYSQKTSESAVKDKFAKSAKLYAQIKETEGAAKKRKLAEQRRELLNENPSMKYIDDNMKSIYKQLEDKGLLKLKGDCP